MVDEKTLKIFAACLINILKIRVFHIIHTNIEVMYYNDISVKITIGK